MLAKILERRRERVAAAKSSTPAAELRARSVDLPPARDFTGALRRARGLALVAEIKRASPARGPIALALDPAERARTYAAAGADCLSILTEPDFFRGSLDDLRAGREACTLPVLRKDFTVDAWQIWEARAAGADAVLLIAAALPGGMLDDLRGVAREAGVAALVEVHDEAELERAGDAELVGVNNRDLRTLEVRLDTMARLLPRVRPGAVAIGESGCRRRADAEAARAAGARALLVGEALVTQADPAALVRELKLL